MASIDRGGRLAVLKSTTVTFPGVTRSRSAVPITTCPFTSAASGISARAWSPKTDANCGSPNTLSARSRMSARSCSSRSGVCRASQDNPRSLRSSSSTSGNRSRIAWISVPLRAASAACVGGRGGLLPSTSPRPDGASGRGGRGSGPTGLTAHAGSSVTGSAADTLSSGASLVSSPHSQREPHRSSASGSLPKRGFSRAYQLSSCAWPRFTSRGPSEPPMNSASSALVMAT